MAFYPLNTPLINYFFYKAPFINDAYSLTGFQILSGGAGFAVNDILILGGGTYTNPAVIKVTSVLSGVITGFIITNNGKYTVTPTVMTMLSTNGSGTGATFGTVVSTPNLYPVGPNVPLAGGFIYFYEDENRTVQANTYSDVSDNNNPVINPNPIQLGSSGDFPPIYMEDRLYYIVITDNTGDEANPVEVLEHYDPSDLIANASAFNDNFIINPQFNFPIDFAKTTDEPGEITKATTVVAWAWEFLEDENTDSKNYVTFEQITGQSIEGNPINQIVIDCQDTTADESLKDLRSYLGEADFYNDSDLTFGAQMIRLGATNINVTLLLEINYGDQGSPAELIELTTFNVGVARNKFAFAFPVPSIAGKTIGEGNYLALRIRSPLQTISRLGITNVMCVPGNQLSVVFSDEPYGFSKAEIIGEATSIDNAGLPENYSPYYYVDGKIIPYANTGDIILCPTDAPQPFRHICDHASLKINGYNDQDIPYRRLYDVIGTTFGSGGDLIVTAKANVVTFASPVGAREKTPYTAGTTAFTVANTIIGLFQGIDLIDNNDMSVSGSFYNQFAPSQTTPVFPNVGAPTITTSSPAGLMAYWGSPAINTNNIQVTTLTPGSGVTNATFELTFTSLDPAQYQTRETFVNDFYVASSFLEFADFAINSRQPGGNPEYINSGCRFSLDGQVHYPIGVRSSTGAQLVNISSTGKVLDTVDFKSALSMKQNIKIFIATVANPFNWTITVTGFPTAGQYCLYSSGTIDYYFYFTVNGVGVDPAIVGRTGTAVPIFAGQTNEQIAEIIAETLNSGTFNVPDPSDLPDLVTSSKVSWFINL